MSALIAAAMLLIFCATMFADENQFFVASNLDPVVTDYAIDEGYPWVYDAELSDGYNVAYCAGNSYKGSRGVSIIAITVTDTGGLGFNHNISIRETGYDYGLYYDIVATMSKSLHNIWYNNGICLGFIHCDEPVDWFGKDISSRMKI